MDGLLNVDQSPKIQALIHLNADMDGVRETLGRALPNNGEHLLEVGLVQLLLEEQHVLVEVLNQAVHVAAAVRDEGASLE